MQALVGKIATGFRLESSPNPHLFTDKFIIRLRSLDQQDSELFLGIHYKLYGNQTPAQIALNLSINMMVTEGIEHTSLMSGFLKEQVETLQSFLRQPLRSFNLSKEQFLTLEFAHQDLVFEYDREDDHQELHLGWALGE